MATASSRLPREATLSLEHFLARNRSILLYRRIQRSLRQVADPTSRQELKRWARSDFDRHRHEKDLSKIRYLYSTGARQVQQMEASFALSR